MISRGLMAQWIRHRPTESGITGSSPAGVIAFIWSLEGPQTGVLAHTEQEPNRHSTKQPPRFCRRTIAERVGVDCGPSALRLLPRPLVSRRGAAMLGAPHKLTLGTAPPQLAALFPSSGAVAEPLLPKKFRGRRSSRFEGREWFATLS